MGSRTRRCDDGRKAVIVTHPQLAAESDVVENTVSALRMHGFDVRLTDSVDQAPFGSKTAHVDEDTEIVVVLGGDGTILRAAELVKGTTVPILGVNLGHVGFLAEFESFELKEAVKRIANCDYTVERRIMADVELWLPDASEPLRDWALNDITVEHTDRGSMIEVGIEVDDVAMSSFGCDGVIVSTPTGSTAYAFSAGGPVIWPGVEALELTPLAAHALFARPLIIGSQSTFSIDVLNTASVNSGAWICCDGRRQGMIPNGSRIVVKASSSRLRLAHLENVPFTKRLVSKFDLPVIGWREQSKRSAHRRWNAGLADAGSGFGALIHGGAAAPAGPVDTVASHDGTPQGDAPAAPTEAPGADRNPSAGPGTPHGAGVSDATHTA
ncbi:MAG: NAD kinase [Bifidobacteriaceae bacterium]|nr:NAD kinase [Bifidobacteriaceae bacterium]